MNLLEKFLKNFYDYLWDVLPYFLLALLVTAFIQTYLNLSYVRRFMKNSVVASLMTSVVGGLLPVCSCSMVPVALMINSFSKSYAPVVSFLIVAPVVSPVTIILTYALFGLNIAVFRVLFTFAFAFITAYLVHVWFKKPSQIPMGMSSKKSLEGRFSLFWSHLVSTLQLTGKYIFIGIAIAAFIKAVVPSTWAAYMSKTILSYPLISLVSIPIYVCSGEDVPIAKALLDIGFTQGNALTFMLASSGVCLPTVIAVMSFLPRKVVALYVTAWFLLSTLMGLLYDYLIFGIL